MEKEKRGRGRPPKRPLTDVINKPPPLPPPTYTPPPPPTPLTASLLTVGGGALTGGDEEVDVVDEEPTNTLARVTESMGAARNLPLVAEDVTLILTILQAQYEQAGIPLDELKDLEKEEKIETFEDFERALLTCCLKPLQKKPKLVKAKRLYALAQRLLKQALERIPNGSTLSTADAVDTFKFPPPGGAVKERNTRFSLYQRGVDTFLFTSSFDFTQQIENLSLAGEVKPLAIIPKIVTCSNAPTMAQLSGADPDLGRKRLKFTSRSQQEDKNFRICPGSLLRPQENEWAPSFSPSWDSTEATISTELISELWANPPPLFISPLSSLPPPSSSQPSESDVVVVTNEQVEQWLNNLGEVQSEETVEQNTLLIDQLQRLQQARFLKSKDTPTSEELILAAVLKDNLSKLLLTTPMKEVMDQADQLRKVMEALPVLTPVFKGSLPATRPFAYFSNYGNREVHPATATVVPPYPTPSYTTSAIANNTTTINTLQQHYQQSRFSSPSASAVSRIRNYSAITSPPPTSSSGTAASTAAYHPVYKAKYTLPAQTGMSTGQAIAAQVQSRGPILREWSVGAGSKMPPTKHGGPRCWNCGTAESPGWRSIKGSADDKLCNACGLYYMKWGKHRTMERSNGKGMPSTTGAGLEE